MTVPRMSPDSFQSPMPSGFIEHATRGVRVWLTGRHYRSLLSAGVQDSLQLVVEDRDHNQTPSEAPRNLVDAVVPDFPPALHPHVQGLGKHLKAAVDQAAANAIAEIQPEIDLNVRAIDDLQADVVDSRNLANATNEFTNPPAPQIPDNNHVQTLKSLAHLRATRFQLRFLALSALLVSGLVTGAEGTLVYLSLLAVFEGVYGVSRWMLPAQAVVITLGMMYLAHKSRQRSGTNTDWRWLSRTSLCLIALALAALRAGVVVLQDEELAVSPFAAFESWGLVMLVFLVSVVLAVLGAEAYDRARDLFGQADALWSDPQASLGVLEGTVATTEAERQTRRSSEREGRRFNALVLERTRRLERDLLRRHRDARALLHREMRRALARLRPVIKNAAWQLARLKHRVSVATATSNERERLLLPALVLGAGLLGTSCQLGSQSALDRHVLLDTSGSVPADVIPSVRAQVLQDVGEWVRTAPSGSAFTIWWLTPEGAAYPAQRVSLTIPPLKVPAHRHRQRLAQDFERRVVELFEQLPRSVRRTRLLESLFYIGSIADGAWHLTVYSDLQQDSEPWDPLRRRLDTIDDAEIVTTMLTICPSVDVPPAQVALRSWPGLVTKHQAGLQEHVRYRALFREFFARWAPAATVRVDAI